MLGQTDNLSHYLTPQPEIDSREQLSDLSAGPQEVDRGGSLHKHGQHTEKHHHEGKQGGATSLR